jgi:hypothetical protein
MSDATSVLFGLEHEFSVLEVRRVDATTVKVIIEQAAREGPCPECGVLSGTVKDRPWMRLKDLPVSGQTVQLWWRKRRLICAEGLCPRKTFTQVSAAVRPRARLTERLRHRVAMAIASGNRAVSEVAGEYGVSWPTAHKALITAAARWLPEPEPTSRLGIDETRFRSVRWILDGITWRRSDPWLTSFVDCSADGPGSLLGLAPGRTGAPVRDWLAAQSTEFRKMIKIVVIDPSAPYASGIRAALPEGSRLVWWTGPEACDGPPASAANREYASGLVSSLVISVVGQVQRDASAEDVPDGCRRQARELVSLGLCDDQRRAEEHKVSFTPVGAPGRGVEQDPARHACSDDALDHAVRAGERGPSLSVGHQLDPAQQPQTTDVADRWVVPELAAQGRVELGASIPCRLNEIELLQNCQHSTARGRPTPWWE